MHQVSILIEGLRARPAQIVVLATLAQVLLWTLVPALFVASPPDDLLEVLTIGHEYPLGSTLGPPLASWLADIAFSLAGGRLIGVFLLSQLCVGATFWLLFVLGRSIVGRRHAAMAVLLMAGIVAFSLPTPDFGPSVLAMPLTALALLHYWRAIGESRHVYWFALAVELGLLMLTTYAGAILFVVLAAFTAATARGRAALRTVDPWAGAVVAVLVMFPHLIWLHQTGAVPLDGVFGVATTAGGDRLIVALLLVAGLIAAVAGLIVFVAFAGGLGVRKREEAPLFERPPVDPFDRQFVAVFALAPLAGAAATALVLGRPLPVGSLAPYLLLASLAVIVAAGDRIRIYRQHAVGWVWLGLLLAPALVLVAVIVVTPFALGNDQKLGDPTAALGRYFTDAFNRRTGKPLRIVVGDTRLAELIALGSPDRPRVYFAAAPERSPWVGAADIDEKGAVVVWQVTDATGAPPAGIRALFPNLVAENSRTFERSIEGRQPPLRLGWALIRPAAAQ